MDSCEPAPFLSHSSGGWESEADNLVRLAHEDLFLVLFIEQIPRRQWELVWASLSPVRTWLHHGHQYEHLSKTQSSLLADHARAQVLNV